MKKILFIDRDGTLIEEPADQQVDALHKIRLLPDVINALQTLQTLGYGLVMVSNQDGLGTPSFPQANFDICQEHVLALFSSQGIHFDEVFICPHMPDDDCDCRKPKAGLLTRYLANTHLDTAASAVIGDRETDLLLAERLGVRGLLIGNGDSALTWRDICVALTPSARTGCAERNTRETAIRVKVNLDSSAPVEIDTGIAFYDHMLEQIAKHAGFSIDVRCDGDLRVDEHHTIEDTALTIGKALRTALGEKRGIARFGFQLPMDESEARVSLDLSGRPYLLFDGSFPRDRVGEMPTELVPHFFRSFADALHATLHISVTGSNTHHMVEACFKALGRALRQAIRIESNDLPSTKGTLS
ncbi:MAG: bifunctional histidinol-phosphatase/imidazoleglycerol-phosphate dehydratase HisB [Gammaproteobacteria bacterium]|nr:bifunctional histidinol-phosphatase/imidazoleglycerol-phosphate dehydratase HisB [Gammaproteobacteria bacterium]